MKMQHERAYSLYWKFRLVAPRRRAWFKRKATRMERRAAKQNKQEAVE